jgi:hypothetical protein
MKPVSSGRRGTDLTGAQVVLRRIAGTTYNLGWGFLRTLREWIRGFHDRLRQRSSSLFMLFGCSSISMIIIQTHKHNLWTKKKSCVLTQMVRIIAAVFKKL